jgi:hypothetical protein
MTALTIETGKSYRIAKAAQVSDSISKVKAEKSLEIAVAARKSDSASRVLAEDNLKIAKIAQKSDSISKVKAEKSLEIAVAARKSDSASRVLAEKQKEIAVSLNLRNAASEYARLIHDGPSEENGNITKFYGDNYFLAYSYKFDSLDSLLKSTDVYTIYKALRNKLYYDNELFSRIYDDFAGIKHSDSVIREVKDFTFPNSENDPVFKAHKTKTGQNDFAFTRSKKSDLTFCATKNNHIYVYEGANQVAEISMGARVTALDYNDGKSIIYFGTSGGYIGYIIYAGNSKKLQPVFKNKLESEITAIQYFEYRDNPNDKTNHFLLAAARTSNTRVYKVEEKSLQPDIHLIGNELPYQQEYGQIKKTLFRNGKIILQTSKGKDYPRYYSWNPFTYDLLKKLKEKKGFNPASDKTKELIDQPDIKFY